MQKIRIEVATVPSYDNEALLITPNYPGLSPGYSSILLRVSTLREIMADKIVAIAGRNYLKARDLWDLKWMMNKSIEVDYAMIKEKLVDYGETESFIPNLEKRLVQMREPKSIKEFEAEMSRFLPTRLRQQMAEIDNFSGRLIASVASQLTGILAVHLGRSIATNNQETLLSPD
jgi:predicted nucleotidyltransferase component of viral defense system